MKRFWVLLAVFAVGAWAQGAGAGVSAAVGQSAAAQSKGAGVEQSAAKNVAAENAAQARVVLEAMIAALGGTAWMNVKTVEEQGRIAGFYHGQPNGAMNDFWSWHEYPDKDRVELTKKRNVIDIIVGDEAWEITYKGKHTLDAKQAAEFLRRRKHSLEVVTREWLAGPGVTLFYDGQVMAERQPAEQVRILTAGGDNATLVVDAQTHLPRSLRFTWRDAQYKDEDEEQTAFDDWHVVDGVSTAMIVSRSHNGELASQRFVEQVKYNGAVAADAFDADAAAKRIKK